MISEDFMIIYLFINTVLTLFNFVMIWKFIGIYDRWVRNKIEKGSAQ